MRGDIRSWRESCRLSALQGDSSENERIRRGRLDLDQRGWSIKSSASRMSDDADETLAAVRGLLLEVVQIRKAAEQHFQTLKDKLDAVDARLVDALERRPKLN
jgi:hypothetical protein